MTGPIQARQTFLTEDNTQVCLDHLQQLMGQRYQLIGEANLVKRGLVVVVRLCLPNTELF